MKKWDKRDMIPCVNQIWTVSKENFELKSPMLVSCDFSLFWSAAIEWQIICCRAASIQTLILLFYLSIVLISINLSMSFLYWSHGLATWFVFLKFIYLLIARWRLA